MPTVFLEREDRAYATGSRKTSVARVWITPGSGRITVNGAEPHEYFDREALVVHALLPLEVAKRQEKVDIQATVNGGGKGGQSGALRQGLARALSILEPELRTPLKKEGLLTRDARAVERKKYGLHKARKRHQYSKR